jgi:hypothetical protein
MPNAAQGSSSGANPVAASQEIPSENPLSDGFAFNLSVPPVTVRMVDATALADYELWLFAASLMFGSVTGFGVAFIQSAEGKGGGDAATGLAAVVFLMLFRVTATLGDCAKVGRKVDVALERGGPFAHTR